jgi:hypothetical protein
MAGGRATTVILSAAKDLADRKTLLLPRSFAALRMTALEGG